MNFARSGHPACCAVTMESLFLAALNGLSYGMLLFMLSAGLTLKDKA